MQLLYILHILLKRLLVLQNDSQFNYAIALTGGIATGKSSIAEKFIVDGVTVIDADKVAHTMLELHQDKVAQLFGAEYVKGGVVNRKALGSLIFSNPEEKLRLEALLHPLIFQEIERQSREEDKKRKPYLIDIPLFFETKRYPIEKSIVVYTPRDKQLERLMERDGSTKDEAQLRIDSQMNIEEKKQRSTYVIDNSYDLNHLQQEYDRVKKEILDSSKG